MIARDTKGRPLVNTPEEALDQMKSDYEAYRIVATLSFSVREKRAWLGSLEHTLSECERAVTGTRAAGHSDDASAWRQIAEFVRAQRDEMRMWLYLREQRYHAAWEALIAAQGSAHWVARWLPDFGPGQHLDEHLKLIACVVFPKQQFFSPSMIIDEVDVECSICHTRGGECDHIAGDVYDGEIASRIIHRIEGVREISMVDNPANRYARAISYADMDLLTGEDVKSSVRPERARSPRRAKKRRR